MEDKQQEIEDWLEEWFEKYFVKNWKENSHNKKEETILYLYKQKIKKLHFLSSNENNEVIKHKDIINVLTKKELKQLLKIKAIIKINQQYYYLIDGLIDPLWKATILIKNAIFCYETASAIIFDYSIPKTIDITVNNLFKYLYYKIKYKCIYNLYYANKKKFNMGIKQYKTFFYGTYVLAYEKERTVCELLTNQKYIGYEESKHIDGYFFWDIDNEITTLNKVLYYAKIFDVQNKVIEYIKNPQYKGHSFVRDIKITH